LVGNVVDDANLAGNALHGFYGGTHCSTAFSGFSCSFSSHAVSYLGVIGIL